MGYRELKNRFSWSFSSASDFEECRRKRYWSKYAMWGGWSPDASEVQRTAYRLNKMSNRFGLQGDAVERAVLWVLRQKQEGKDATMTEAYAKRARPFLLGSWEESQQGLWRKDPKRYCCLHEHYYGKLTEDKEREHQLVREVKENDVVVLCSDGLWGQVADNEIADAVAKHTSEQAAKLLVEAANDRGGPDNITVVILRVPRVPSPRDADMSTQRIANALPVMRPSADRVDRDWWFKVAGVVLLLIAFCIAAYFFLR